MNLDDIERVALRDVYLDRLKRDGVGADFRIRRIFRQYSKMFSTPLHEVYELPTEFVVQAWLEEIYEGWTDADLRKEVQDLVKSYDQLLAERRGEDEMDADTWMIIQEEKRAAREAEKKKRKIEDVVDQIKYATSFIKSNPSRPGAEAELPRPKQVIPEGITMKFEDIDFDGDSFGPPDKP